MLGRLGKGMAMVRLVAALLVTLLVAACATSPQEAASGATGGRSGRGKTPQATGPGSVPGAVIQGPGGQLDLADGVYLASLVVVDIVHDQGVPVAVLPNVGNFPLGDVKLVVLNKWAGLTPGPHKQVVTIDAPDGKTTLTRDETDFSVSTDHVFLSIATPLAFKAETPGFYQVRVALDGNDVARYRFRVRSGN